MIFGVQIVAIDPKGDHPQTSWIHPALDSTSRETEPSRLKMQTLAKRQGIKHYSPVQLQSWFSEVPF
jgi:hypothetical protein